MFSSSYKCLTNSVYLGVVSHKKTMLTIQKHHLKPLFDVIFLRPKGFKSFYIVSCESPIEIERQDKGNKNISLNNKLNE